MEKAIVDCATCNDLLGWIINCGKPDLVSMAGAVRLFTPWIRNYADVQRIMRVMVNVSSLARFTIRFERIAHLAIDDCMRAQWKCVYNLLDSEILKKLAYEIGSCVITSNELRTLQAYSLRSSSIVTKSLRKTWVAKTWRLDGMLNSL